MKAELCPLSQLVPTMVSRMGKTIWLLIGLYICRTDTLLCLEETIATPPGSRVLTLRKCITETNHIVPVICDAGPQMQRSGAGLVDADGLPSSQVRRMS